MKAAKLAKVPDSINRGVNGLPGSDPEAKCATYLSQPTSTSGVNAGMQGKQNSEVRPVAVKKTDFKDLKSGADYRYPHKDTAEPCLERISNGTILRRK